jgi:hypothetical protein
MRDDTEPLNFDARLLMALTWMLWRCEREGREDVEEEDVLDAAVAWTTSTFESPGADHDYRTLTDVLFVRLEAYREQYESD